MPYCTNCGSEISDDAQFCTNCGTPVMSAQMEDKSQGSADSTGLQPQVVYVKRKAQTKEEKADYAKYMKYYAEIKEAERTEGHRSAILHKYGRASDSLRVATEKRDEFLEKNKNSDDVNLKKLSKKASVGGLGISGFLIAILGVILLFNSCAHANSSLNGAGWFFTLVGCGLLGIELYKNDKASKALRAYDAGFDKLEADVEAYTKEKNRLQPLVDKINFVTNYEKTHPEMVHSQNV